MKQTTHDKKEWYTASFRFLQAINFKLFSFIQVMQKYILFKEKVVISRHHY